MLCNTSTIYIKLILKKEILLPYVTSIVQFIKKF